jgi:hypothetical protein
MKTKKVLCDVCNRNMTYRGTSYIGISLSIGEKKPTTKLEKENIGAYKKLFPEIEIGKSYQVCWVCWLKSLGIKL